MSPEPNNPKELPNIIRQTHLILIQNLKLSITVFLSENNFSLSHSSSIEILKTYYQEGLLGSPDDFFSYYIAPSVGMTSTDFHLYFMNLKNGRNFEYSCSAYSLVCKPTNRYFLPLQFTKLMKSKGDIFMSYIFSKQILARRLIDGRTIAFEAEGLKEIQWFVGNWHGMNETTFFWFDPVHDNPNRFIMGGIHFSTLKERKRLHAMKATDNFIIISLQDTVTTQISLRIVSGEYLGAKVLDDFIDIEEDRLDLQLILEWKDFLLLKYSDTFKLFKHPITAEMEAISDRMRYSLSTFMNTSTFPNNGEIISLLPTYSSTDSLKILMREGSEYNQYIVGFGALNIDCSNYDGEFINKSLSLKAAYSDFGSSGTTLINYRITFMNNQTRTGLILKLVVVLIVIMIVLFILLVLRKLNEIKDMERELRIHQIMFHDHNDSISMDSSTHFVKDHH